MKYVHGYDPKENIRLQDQASTLVDLLHSDTFYPDGSQVLEAGCGVGAQTVTLARNSPDAHITSVDISDTSVIEARDKIERAGYTNVSFKKADIFNLPFEPESFDHIFVYPDNPDSHKAIQCQVDLQKEAGGNANIGRELYPLLDRAGFRMINVSPRMVYVDSSRPQLVEGFIKNTFTAMIEGVRESSINKGLIDPKTFDGGIRGLYRTAETDGVFCYTFFKAIAQKNELPNPSLL